MMPMISFLLITWWEWDDFMLGTPLQPHAFEDVQNQHLMQSKT